jgi:DNA replication regulator DPB11
MFVGINLAPTFSCRATHLLCPSGTGLKFEKACQWGIPVVNVHWLVKMAESGQIPGLNGFLVSAPACDVQAPEVLMALDRMDLDEENANDKKYFKGKCRAVEKGKGHARDQGIDVEMLVDVEDQMNDITNSRQFFCDLYSGAYIFLIVDTPPEDQAQPAVFEKPRLLERQPTTIVPQPDPPETSSFGVVQGILSRSASFMPHPSSICTPPPPTRSMVASEEGDPRMRVPSSKSPSPMKSLKNIGGSGSRLSISPVKIDHEATKALQETISSLLGKRPTPEGEELAGAADAPNVRNGKRPRPHRSKVS